MQPKNIEKELDADIRNKLTFPRTILELISKQEKDIDKKHIEKALRDLDEATRLTKKWFEGGGNNGIICSSSSLW